MNVLIKNKVPVDRAMEMSQEICDMVELEISSFSVVEKKVVNQQPKKQTISASKVSEIEKKVAIKNGLGYVNKKGEYVPQGRNVTATQIHKDLN